MKNLGFAPANKFMIIHITSHTQNTITMAMEKVVVVEYLNSSYLTISLISLLSIFLIRHFFFSNSSLSRRLPPSPPSLPFLGHLHLLSPILHQSLHKLSLRYGPLFHLRLGSSPCVVACTADTARYFLKTHEISFSNRPQSIVSEYLSYDSTDFTFAPYGPYWTFMKKLFMADLLGGRTLEQLKHVRKDELHHFLRYILRVAKEGRAFHVGDELFKLANNIVSMMVLSRRCSGSKKEAEEMKTLIAESAELLGQLNLGDCMGAVFKKLDLQGFKKRLEATRGRFDVIMDRIIEEKEEERRKGKGMGFGLDSGEGGRVKDLLDKLLDIHEDKGADMRVTKENIKALILNIFTGGSDTSPITIEWALSELLNHPDVLRKALVEIDSVVGKTRLVDESDIPKLPYLQAIVKETLRLHPTGPMVIRSSSEDSNVDGYDIPAKTSVFVNVWAIGRDPHYWKDPLVFYPERFIQGEQQATDVRGQHFHMLPFGSGRRTCPGASLALLVVQTALAAMIQCFDWKVSNGGPVDMTEGPGITLPRAQTLMCTPVCRLNPFPLA